VTVSWRHVKKAGAGDTSVTYQHAGPHVLVDFVFVRSRTIAAFTLKKGKN
jgi:hypothetical protein